MNSLNSTKVVYKIQDLVIREEITSYKKFKIHFQDEVNIRKSFKNYKALNKSFKGIYTFLKEFQKNPKRIILVQAMGPMFEMLLDEMAPQKFMYVFRKNIYSVGRIIRRRLKHFDSKHKKGIYQKEENIYIDYRIEDWHLDYYEMKGEVERKRERFEIIGLKEFVEEEAEKFIENEHKLEKWKKQEKKAGRILETDVCGFYINAPGYKDLINGW